MQYKYAFPKKKITLDLRVEKKALPSAARTSASFDIKRGNTSYRVLDGIRQEKKTFLTSLHNRSPKGVLVLFLRRSQIYVRRVRRILLALIPDMSAKKVVYASIVSGIVFGMASMTLIAHVFGTGVFARSEPETLASLPVAVAEDIPQSEETGPEYNPNQDIFFEYFDEATKEQYENNVREMVKGYPIEAMLPYIFEQDRMTAAFLVGIAKKESNWGKRVPVLDGQDCFNYWGYRGIRRMMGSGGHTCFNSRKDAVETVAARLEKLIHSEKLDTPEKLIVWKCGFSCQGHSRESVKKWISDVDMYYEQLKDE